MMGNLNKLLFILNKGKIMGYKKSQDYIDYHSNYRKNNRKWLKEKNRIFRKENPWMESWYKIRQRCNNPNNKDYHRYGGRGIKALISKEEIKELWFRDKAYLMKNPTIDREDNNGNYTLENCQWLENTDNSAKDKGFKIAQYDINNNLIKTWDNQTFASKELGYSQSWLSICIKNNKLGYGFYWKELK